jgi:hypothetical protein
MIIPFCGQTYQDKSLSISAQKCQNWYADFDLSNPESKPRFILRPTPGSLLFKDLSGQNIRVGGLYEYDSILYAVCDNKLYSVDTSGTSALLGTLNTSSGVVNIVDNTLQLVISDGLYGYYYTFATGVFAQITDPDFPGASTLTYQDGYVLAVQPNSSNVYQSDLLNASSWSATAMVTPITFTNKLVAGYSDGRELYLIGKKGTEVRYDSGDIPFAFAKRTDVIIQMGMASAATYQKIDNTSIWLASDKNGQGFVIALNGYIPEIISTPALNETFERYSTISDAFAFVYKEGNSQFYVLTFPTMNATWVYNRATKLWHEWSSFNVGRHISNAYAFFNGKHVVGDYASGKLYYISQDYLDDNSGIIQRIRRAPTLDAERKKIFFREVEVEMETGVGVLSGQGSSPLATLRISRDGGHTYTSCGTANMGVQGDYRKRLRWRQLGSSDLTVFELATSEPVKPYIYGAIAQVTVGLK